MPYPAVAKQIREAGSIFSFSLLLTVLHYVSLLIFYFKEKMENDGKLALEFRKFRSIKMRMRKYEMKKGSFGK